MTLVLLPQEHASAPGGGPQYCLCRNTYRPRSRRKAKPGPGTQCLGSNLAPRGSTRDSDAQVLGGTDAALQDVTTRVGKEATVLVDLTSHSLSKQTAASLLRYLLVGAPQHILRTGIPLADKVAGYDAVCKRAWEQLAQANMTTDMWRQAQWPLAAGGLATGSIEHRHLAAFVAGTHESVPHVAGRLGYVTTQEYFTAHQEAKTPLQTASAQVNRLAPKLPHQSWDGPVLPPQMGLQRKFTRAMQDADRANFLQNATDTDPRQATRVRACGGPGAGAVHGYNCLQHIPSTK